MFTCSLYAVQRSKKPEIQPLISFVSKSGIALLQILVGSKKEKNPAVLLLGNDALFLWPLYRRCLIVHICYFPPQLRKKLAIFSHTSAKKPNAHFGIRPFRTFPATRPSRSYTQLSMSSILPSSASSSTVEGTTMWSPLQTARPHTLPSPPSTLRHTKGWSCGSVLAPSTRTRSTV